MILGKPVFLAQAGGYITIKGAPGEFITVYDYSSGDQLEFTIHGEVVDHLTLEASGDLVVPEYILPQGTYNFEGSSSKYSRIPKTNVTTNPENHTTVTMWPSDCTMIYWFGRFGTYQTMRIVSVDPTPRIGGDLGSGITVQGSSAAGGVSTQRFEITTHPYTSFYNYLNLVDNNAPATYFPYFTNNSEDGLYFTGVNKASKEGSVKWGISPPIKFVRYTISGATQTISYSKTYTLCSPYTHDLSSSELNELNIGNMRVGYSSTNTTVTGSAKWINSVYKNVTNNYQWLSATNSDVSSNSTPYLAARGWYEGSSKVVGGHIYAVLLANSIDTVEPTITKLGSTREINISTVSSDNAHPEYGALRYSSENHYGRDGTLKGGGWYSPYDWSEMSNQSLFGKKNRSSGGGYQREATLIPIPLGSDSLTGKTLANIVLSFNGLCPNEDFAKKGFRWAISTSGTSSTREKYQNTTSKVTTDSYQLATGTAKINYYGQSTWKSHSITLKIDKNIFDFSVDGNYLFVYLYPAATDNYGIAHLKGTIKADIYVSS